MKTFLLGLLGHPKKAVLIITVVLGLGAYFSCYSSTWIFFAILNNDRVIFANTERVVHHGEDPIFKLQTIAQTKKSNLTIEIDVRGIFSNGTQITKYDEDWEKPSSKLRGKATCP